MARRRPRPETRPLVAVTEAACHSGNSGLGLFKSSWWVLTLACGHEVERNIRWLPPADGSRPPRGYGAQHHPPGRDRLPPPPTKARCDDCPPLDAA